MRVLKEEPLGKEEFVQPKAQGKRLAGINDMSEELKDMMGLMATASRAGCGHVCWCGWNAYQHERPCAKKEDWKPKTGAQFLMLTAVGARKMLEWMMRSEPAHMGWTLKKFFEECQSSVGMCWLKPPVGGFVSHPPQCTSAPKGKHIRSGRYVLRCQWQAPWVQEGTRKNRDEDVHRGIFQFDFENDCRD